MLNMTQADWIMLAVGAFIAVTALVRLMRARRDQLLVQLREQMEAENRRRLAEERRKKQATAEAERKAS